MFIGMYIEFMFQKYHAISNWHVEFISLII